MSRRDDRFTLRQIIEYVGHAQALCADKTAQQIEADWRQAFAFERVMEVLGEAVKRLSEGLRHRYSQVPWKLVTGMRGKISHQSYVDGVISVATASPCEDARANADVMLARMRTDHLAGICANGV